MESEENLIQEPLESVCVVEDCKGELPQDITEVTCNVSTVKADPDVRIAFVNTNIDEGDSYTKRKGTGDMSGLLYEVKMACLIFLRCVASDCMFRLAANHSGAGDFDDLVLQVHERDGSSQTYCIQLKHKQNKDSISWSDLLSLNLKAPFSVYKYFVSYRDKICPQFEPNAECVLPAEALSEVSLVLYTNVKAIHKSNVSDNIKDMLSTNSNGSVFSVNDVEDKELATFLKHIESHRENLHHMKDNLEILGINSNTIKDEVSKIMNKYEIPNTGYDRKLGETFSRDLDELNNDELNEETFLDILNKKICMWDLKPFLKKLILFTGQISVDGLEKEIREQLSKLFGHFYGESDHLYLQLIDKVQLWWQAATGKYLSRKCSLWRETLDEVLRLANEEAKGGLNQLKFTFEERETITFRNKLESTRLLLCIVENKCTDLGLCKAQQTLEHINTQFLMGTGETVLTVWETQWCDILLTDYHKEDREKLDRLKEIIECKPEKKVILVIAKEELPIEESLRNLKGEEFHLNILISDFDDESQKQILGQDIMFQGHIIPLRQLINEQQNLSDGILEELINNKPTHICKSLEPLISHYIPRTLQRADILDPCLITELFQQRGRVFFLSGISEWKLRELVKSNKQVRRFDGKVVPECMFYILDDDNLLLPEGYVGNYFHVTKTEKGFQVQSFTGDINIDRYVDKDKFTPLQPNSAWDLPGRVVVIAAEPGMGKSTLTTNLALRTKEKEPATWVVRVNLGSMSRDLEKVKPEEIDKEFVISFLMKSLGCSNLFEKHLFQSCANTIGNVVVFFDGFDEICPDYEDQVVAIFSNILGYKIRKIVVSSRLHLMQKLQNSLKLIPFLITEFSPGDQRRFLEKTWTERSPEVDKDYMKKLISDIQKLFCSSHYDIDRTILGIPLQTFIVSEVFFEYLVEGRCAKYMDIVELYEALFEKKCKVYFVEKLELNTAHPWIKIELEKKKKIIEEMHLCSAMMMYMTSEDLSKIHDKSLSDTGSKYLKEHDCLSIGLLQLAGEGKIEFLHRTIMEFFVSKWLIKNHQQNTTFIQSKIFSDLYFVIRRMFNIMLAEGNELHTAVINSDVESLKSKLNHENVNSMDKGGRTLMHTALTGDRSHDNFRKMIEILLNHGADLEVADKILHWSAVQYADYSDNWVVLEMMLEKRNVKLKLVNIRTNVLRALIIGCDHGYLNLVEYLVTECMNVATKCKYLNKGLQQATQKVQVKVIDYLLSAGADVHARFLEYDCTALHMAMYNWMQDSRVKDEDKQKRAVQRMNAVQLLIEKGAEVNARDGEMKTPLHLAAETGDSDVVRLLLDNGSEVNARDIYKRTALHRAAKNSSLEVVQCLIDHGSEMESVDKSGKTALLYASERSHLEILQCLIQHGSKVDAVDNIGKSALHYASKGGCFEIIRCLIDNRCNVDAADDNGNTALHWVARLGYLNVVQCLLEVGSKLVVKNVILSTPRMHANENEQSHFAYYIFEQECKVKAANQTRKTRFQFGFWGRLFGGRK